MSSFDRLDQIGGIVNEFREALFTRRECGPTSIYNLFHDPDESSADIQKLRQLHVEMDNAVASAYGWADLDLGHGFHETKQGIRYTISEAARREVLARLLKLNHERYAEEVAQGLHEKKKAKPAAGRGRRSSAAAPAPSLFPDAEAEDDPPTDRDGEAEDSPADPASSAAEPDSSPAPADRPPAIDEIDTDEVMAAFRQSTRNRGWLGRDELLKEVSQQLGYQRLGAKVEEALRGHLRAAIRRKIIEADGDQVRAGHATMEAYSLDELRETLCSVMRPGKNHDRDEVIQAVVHHLGFRRLRDSVLAPVKSAINSAIRQGLLKYEGNVIWREK